MATNNGSIMPLINAGNVSVFRLGNYEKETELKICVILYKPEQDISKFIAELQTSLSASASSMSVSASSMSASSMSVSASSTSASSMSVSASSHEKAESKDDD
jgi:hypothetical protein